jgi:hypothetical protein
MNEITGLVRQADTHAAGILIANQPLLLDWPLLGGLELLSSTQPRRGLYTGSGRRRDHATAKVHTAAYIELIDLVIPPFQGMRLVTISHDHGRLWAESSPTIRFGT